MNVFKRVRDLKDKLQRERTISKANTLEGLRKERLKLQGRVKVSNYERIEKAKIYAAKERLREDSFTGKVSKFLKETKKKNQSRIKTRKSYAPTKREVIEEERTTDFSKSNVPKMFK